jgi:hypothetical protein
MIQTEMHIARELPIDHRSLANSAMVVIPLSRGARIAGDPKTPNAKIVYRCAVISSGR